MKYTLEFKLKCVEEYKKNGRIDFAGTREQRKHLMIHVRGWAVRFDQYGVDGLRHPQTNKRWTSQEKFALVAKVIAGGSMRDVAKNGCIPYGMLYQWVKRYRERGMEGLECRQGKPPKVPIMPKKETKLTPSEKEELELLRARNEFLEAENLYLKKLDALVTKREAARPKARKRKSSKR